MHMKQELESTYISRLHGWCSCSPQARAARAVRAFPTSLLSLYDPSPRYYVACICGPISAMTVVLWLFDGSNDVALHTSRGSPPERLHTQRPDARTSLLWAALYCWGSPIVVPTSSRRTCLGGRTWFPCKTVPAASWFELSSTCCVEGSADVLPSGAIGIQRRDWLKILRCCEGVATVASRQSPAPAPFPGFTRVRHHTQETTGQCGA